MFFSSFYLVCCFFSLFSILNHIHWHVIELVQSARSIRSRNLRLHDSRDAFKRKYKCLEVLYCCQFALLCVCVYCVFVRPKSDTLTPNQVLSSKRKTNIYLWNCLMISFQHVERHTHICPFIQHFRLFEHENKFYCRNLKVNCNFRRIFFVFQINFSSSFDCCCWSCYS